MSKILTIATVGEEIIFETGEDCNYVYRVRVEDGRLLVSSMHYSYGKIPINVTIPRPHILSIEQVKREPRALYDAELPPFSFTDGNGNYSPYPTDTCNQFVPKSR